MSNNASFTVGKRNQNLDVFRCLLMFLIVTSHCFCHGIWGGAREWWTLFFSTAIIWHVDGFIAISGWFGVRFSWKKWFRLLGVIVFYNIVDVIWRVAICHEPFALHLLRLSGGWFGNAYLMQMLLAPVLNSAIEGMLNQGRRALLSAWMLFAVGFTINWLSHGLVFGPRAPGMGSYTLWTMVFIYFTVRVARLSLSADQLRKIAKTGLLAFPCGITILGGSWMVYHLIRGRELDWRLLGEFSSYDAPHVWLFAAALMIVFATRVKMPNRIGAFCSKLSPAMFGVYMLHDNTLVGPAIYRWVEYRIPSPIMSILIASVTVFVSCTIVDSIRHLIADALSRKLFKNEC